MSPRKLQNEIKQDFRADNSVWSNYKNSIASEFAQINYQDLSDHLLREFNRKIVNLGLSRNFMFAPFDAGFRFTGSCIPTLDFNFAEDKTIVPRIGPTPTFTRGSGATQVNASGLIEYAPENLVLRSQEFNTSWAVNNAMTVTPNAVTAPDGTLTADAINFDANASSRIIQFAGSAAVHTFSVWLRAETDRTCIIETQAASAFSVSLIANVTTTWQRFSVVATNWTSGTGSYNVRIANNVAGTSGTIYAWGAQLERNAVARTYNPTTSAPFHAPRFDHDPVTLACKGLLIEESRTNLCLRSEEFNDGIWAKSSAIVTAPMVTADQVNSPSGALSADRIAFPAVSGAGAFSLVNQVFSQPAGVVYTASIYLRGLVGGEKLWWTWTPNGTTYVRKECILTTAWQRFDFTYTSTAGNNFIQLGVDLRDASQSAQLAQTIFAWGAQLEVGSFPTSYIPTTSTAALRSADVCSITGADFTSFYNPSEGTVSLQATSLMATATAGNRTFLSFTDGGYTNQQGIYKTVNSSNLNTPIGSGVGTTVGTITQGVAFKVAVAFQPSNSAASFNGGAAATVSSAAVVGINKLELRDATGAPGGHPSCHIARIQYFKKHLPNTELQSLTTL